MTGISPRHCLHYRVTLAAKYNSLRLVVNSMSHSSYALLGFAGFSGSGKTTLLEQLVRLLSQQGLRIGLIKHTHHDVEQDSPGKDSFRLRHAGASQCLLAGPKRTIVTFEHPQTQDADLYACLAKLKLDQVDLVLVEGFRDAAIPKLEIHRPCCQKPLLCRHDPYILALATDEPSIKAPVPLLDLNDATAIAEQITQWWQEGRLGVPAVSAYYRQDNHSEDDKADTTTGAGDNNADGGPPQA